MEVTLPGQLWRAAPTIRVFHAGVKAQHNLLPLPEGRGLPPAICTPKGKNQGSPVGELSSVADRRLRGSARQTASRTAQESCPYNPRRPRRRKSSAQPLASPNGGRWLRECLQALRRMRVSAPSGAPYYLLSVPYSLARANPLRHRLRRRHLPDKGGI